MPSTAANAMSRSANVARSESVKQIAHWAFFMTLGIVSIALKSFAFSESSSM